MIPLPFAIQQALGTQDIGMPYAMNPDIHGWYQAAHWQAENGRPYDVVMA